MKSIYTEKRNIRNKKTKLIFIMWGNQKKKKNTEKEDETEMKSS